MTRRRPARGLDRRHSAPRLRPHGGRRGQGGRSSRPRRLETRAARPRSRARARWSRAGARHFRRLRSASTEGEPAGGLGRVRA